jgi:hypothetical protein
MLQKIYKTNNMNNPSAHAQYQLSELELPSKRPSGRGVSSTPPPGKSVLADMTYSIEMVRHNIEQTRACRIIIMYPSQQRIGLNIMLTSSPCKYLPSIWLHPIFLVVFPTAVYKRVERARV